MNLILPKPVELYNKQWKRLFTFTTLNEHMQLVDSAGIVHNERALREPKPSDYPPFYTI